MSGAGNPFVPDFGQAPPVMAGRDIQLARFGAALARGPSDPALTSLMLGARATGKTTLGAAVAKSASQAGWAAIRVAVPLDAPEGRTALDMLASRCRQTEEALADGERGRVSGFSLPVIGGGMQFDKDAPPDRSEGLHDTLSRTLEALTAGRRTVSGLLVVVDEIHNLGQADAGELAGCFEQITKIEGRPLAFIGSGLPEFEVMLNQQKGFTFFQRCFRVDLENLSLSESMHAIGAPFRARGIDMPADLLQRAALATGGLPFATQSVGYWMWEATDGGTANLDGVSVGAAIDRMHDEVARKVVAPIWSHLSVGDREFLAAMLPDDGPSKPVDVYRRLKNPDSGRTYKARLTKAGAIRETALGTLTFADSTLRARIIEATAEQRLIEEHQRDQLARRKE